MGVTGFSFELLKKHGATREGTSMLELGDQNIYFGDEYGKYAKDIFQRNGVIHTSIDLGTQTGGAIEEDLSKPFDLDLRFSVVTNFGTSEHVSNLYECFKNIDTHCLPGGIMVHENPKTGNWPGHGFHYMTEDFYRGLAEKCNYQILELGQHPAMGNTTDGWNIYCVLMKWDVKPFISEEEFNKLDFRKS